MTAGMARLIEIYKSEKFSKDRYGQVSFDTESL